MCSPPYWRSRSPGIRGCPARRLETRKESTGANGKNAGRPSPSGRGRRAIVTLAAISCYWFATEHDRTAKTGVNAAEYPQDLTCPYRSGRTPWTRLMRLRIRRLGVRVPPSALNIAW
jgi:hypothetical protein